MPYNTRETLKNWLSEEDVDQAYINSTDTQELAASLDQSAALVSQESGADIPGTVDSNVHKTLQFADAWYWAYFSLKRLDNPTSELQETVRERYVEAKAVLQQYAQNRHLNDAESSLRPQTQVGSYNSIDQYNEDINSGLKPGKGGGFFTEW